MPAHQQRTTSKSDQYGRRGSMARNTWVVVRSPHLMFAPLVCRQYQYSYSSTRRYAQCRPFMNSSNMDDETLRDSVAVTCCLYVLVIQSLLRLELYQSLNKRSAFFDCLSWIRNRLRCTVHIPPAISIVTIRAAHT